MSYSVKNLNYLKGDKVARGTVDDGEVVVQIDLRMGAALPVEISRLAWKHHIHRPAEPLHESILKLIAERMAELVNEAHASGYELAQAEIRRALGLPE